MTPHPLGEDIVHPAAAPVLGDGAAGPLQRRREGAAVELVGLVGVEDVGLAVTGDCLLQRSDAGARPTPLGWLPIQRSACRRSLHAHLSAGGARHRAAAAGLAVADEVKLIALTGPSFTPALGRIAYP